MENMEHQLIFKTSKEHMAKTLLKGGLCWVIFNLLTGLITGDISLNDNYFILSLIIAYVALVASYEVKIDRGHITIYQASMITSNINLYSASKVLNEKGKLIVICPNDTRFVIRYSRFGESEKSQLLEIVVPQAGDRPKVAPKLVEQYKLTKTEKFKPNHTKNIFGGIGITIFGLFSLFSEVIYMPSRYGSIYLENEPTAFYIYLTNILIFGVGIFIYGSYGKLKKRNA
jgi:hypothetical protein